MADSRHHRVHRTGCARRVRDRKHLRQWLYRVAQDHGTRIDAVSYVLMDNRALLKYNRDFLQHDDLTDVITFPGGEQQRR